MNIDDEFPPTEILDRRHEELLDPGDAVRHLARATCEGLMRTLEANTPGFAARHELVFLFRNSGARNNREALTMWVEGVVKDVVDAGVPENEVFAFVDARLHKAFQDAGWC